MTDEEVEKIIKSNMNLQMNLPGIRADFEEKLQRTWVGLTGGEIDECFAITPDQYLPWQIYQRIEKRLKEKNT